MAMEYFVPIVTAASSLLILYSTYKLNRELKKERASSSSKEIRVKSRKGYVMRVKELEYRRDMIKNAILNVIKEFEAGNIDESTKDALLTKFQGELDKIESELNSIKKYAELERLEYEYEKLVSEYEKKKSQLEKRIASLKESLSVREEKVQEKSGEKTRKAKEEKEESLEDIMEEINKFMKEFGEE